MVELHEYLFHSLLNSEESVLLQNKFEKKKEKNKRAIPVYLVEVSMVIYNMQNTVFGKT